MVTFEQFEELAQLHKTIPVYERFLADLLTPISAFIRLAGDSQYNFLLESVEKGTRYSRYSFLGRDPRLIIRYQQGQTSITDKTGVRISKKTLFDTLREVQEKYRPAQLPELPALAGGLVGYLGYEAVNMFEDIPIYEGDYTVLPDSIFMLFEDLLAFDHLKNEVLVISNVNVAEYTDKSTAYERARLRIEQIRRSLHSDIHYRTPVQHEHHPVKSETTPVVYKQWVQQAKEHILAGDIFQVVLSQKFTRVTSAQPLTIYRALRAINPSPYMFLLRVETAHIIGASPELLVKVKDSEVEVRPIAGTRPVGKTNEENLALRENMLADEKELAEHLMLVDLGRNDVGRVAEFGSIHVPEMMAIEQYSHVMHIVSSVKGTMRKEFDALDALSAVFPAGTLTGAPKIRAMEIIHDLEQTRRGVYGGVIGYYDFSGAMDTCIAIRTMVLENGLATFQAGAGIVHDSVPETEYQECINKARALIAAIDFAEDGLIARDSKVEQ